MGGDTKLYTQAEVESRESMARIETLLSVNRDDFNEHRKEDDTNFSQLFEKLDTIPVHINKCKDKLSEDIHKDVAANYVPKLEYKIFVTKLTWGVVGATAIASVISWALQLATQGMKLLGG